MIELATAIAAALLGVLLDRLRDWHDRRRRLAGALRDERLTQYQAARRINDRIDGALADEGDLSALVDRL